MSIALILAAGKAERHNGGNKPLLKVGKETLLERMVRQVRPWVGAAYIVTHREDITHPNCKSFLPQSHDFICDTLYCTTLIWCLGSKTIVLLGDVYYSDLAMIMISGERMETVAYVDLANRCNIHALYIPYRFALWTAGKLGEFTKLVNKEPAEHKFGKLHAFCDWARVKRIPLDKDTTDIDSPQEHKRLLARLEL